MQPCDGGGGRVFDLTFVPCFSFSFFFPSNVCAGARVMTQVFLLRAGPCYRSFKSRTVGRHTLVRLVLFMKCSGHLQMSRRDWTLGLKLDTCIGARTESPCGWISKAFHMASIVCPPPPTQTSSVSLGPLIPIRPRSHALAIGGPLVTHWQASDVCVVVSR